MLYEFIQNRWKFFDNLWSIYPFVHGFNDLYVGGTILFYVYVVTKSCKKSSWISQFEIYIYHNSAKSSKCGVVKDPQGVSKYSKKGKLI